MNRKETLDTAALCVLGDRTQAYGSPEDNFRTTATIWTAHLQGRGLLAEGKSLGPEDVAALMIGLKLARLVTSIDKADTWVDIAGYAACGAEVSAPKT